MKKRFLAILLAWCLIAGMLSVSAVAQGNAADTWDGTVASEFAGGSGTENDPYQIFTAEQFAYFAKCLENDDSFQAYGNKYYVLTNDIDLSGYNWTPIRGTKNDLFSGTFFKGNLDGQGHTISYEFTKSAKTMDFEGYGLFGFSEGTFANLNIEGDLTIDCYVYGSWSGGLAGLQAGDVTNCTSSVNITITRNAETNACSFGGIAGEMQGGTMKNCLYTGNISANHQKADGDFHCGGLAGALFAGTITACKNEGTIDGKEHINIGGIAGLVYTGGDGVTSIISECYHTGSVSGNHNIGGIAGSVSAVISAYNQGNAISKVVNCYAAGTVSQSSSSLQQCGAVCGLLDSNDYGNQNRATAAVEDSYYTDDVGIPDDNATLTTLTKIYDDITANNRDGAWVKDNEGNAVLYWEIADYTDVDNAIENIPEDLSQYTDESVAELNTAVNAVVRDLLRKEQATVDDYATAIENAIDALVYKGADYTAVDAAIAAAEALDPDDYTDFSGVTAAIGAVDRTKNIAQQDEVDAMAKAINDAINALVYKGADYTAVDAAIAAAEALNPDDYTDFSGVTAAIGAVDRTKDITEQSEVDAMAKAINNAIDALERKPTDIPKTGDNSNMALWIALLLISGGVVVVLGFAQKRRTVR